MLEQDLMSLHRPDELTHPPGEVSPLSMRLRNDYK